MGNLLSRDAPPSTTVTDLSDDALNHVLSFLSHSDGKATFAQTGRRARDAHSATLPPGFVAWVSQLSPPIRHWVAGLAVAPPTIRAGFESGEACRDRPLEVLRSVTDDSVKRLESLLVRLPQSAALPALQHPPRNGLPFTHLVRASLCLLPCSRRPPHSYPYPLSRSSLSSPHALPLPSPPPTLSHAHAQALYHTSLKFLRPRSETVAAFLALGLLTDARIEELLNAKLSKARWAVVFEQGGPRGVSAPYCTSLCTSL